MYDFIQKFSRIVPCSIRTLLRRYISFTAYDLSIRAKGDPYANDPPYFDFPGSPYTLGIIKEFAHYHKAYITACREMGVSYRLLDISGTNWIRVVQESNCDAYLVWPSAILKIWKEMYDERMYCLNKEMGFLIYPTIEEIWIYENKRRVHYWLEAHHVPHPQTWVFYNPEEALQFIQQVKLPLVLKTNTGASASGVFILRCRAEAETYIQRAFSRGIVARRQNPKDRHWGYVLLQEYLEVEREWRMVCIGDSFFGHSKGRRGDYHSGSGVVLWDVPPVELLEFTKQVTDTGVFTSMDVDIFETVDGRYLVNELHTVFGASISIDQMRMNGQPGRFVKNKVTGEWIFEEGDFSRNMCANARVDYLINHLLPSRKKK